jgi:hypothetical protein
MLALVLTVGIAGALAQDAKEVTAAEKAAFIQLLHKLPTHGEFLADEVIPKAAPYTRVLFALTKHDLDQQELYPFVALSWGLLERKDQQAYGRRRFGKIAHPDIKLGWALLLFKQEAASPEIVQFLRQTMAAREQAKKVSEWLGPEFDDFQKQLAAYPRPKQ